MKNAATIPKRILFLHPNFPAQFRHLAATLAQEIKSGLSLQFVQCLSQIELQNLAYLNFDLVRIFSF